jgi:hypothetical protein
MLILATGLLITSAGCARQQPVDPPDTEAVLRTIEELAGPVFAGRASGTEGGVKAEEYVAARFAEIGLAPGGENGTYFQQFTGMTGNPVGPYILEVLDGTQVIKSYRWAVDFRSITTFTNEGEATGRGILVDDGSMFAPQAMNGEIALVMNSQFNHGPNNTLASLRKLMGRGYSGAVVLMESGLSRYKGQEGREDAGGTSRFPRVGVTNEVFNELQRYTREGFSIHIKSNYQSWRYTARNTIGVLKSTIPSNRYLLISAHVDHLAPDPDGVYFPGAFDNASGTAAVIEIARALKQRGFRPSVNLVFVAFAGEEQQMLGSAYYVSHSRFPLEGTTVLNLDMLGAKNPYPLSIWMESTGPENTRRSAYVREVAQAAADEGALYNIIKEWHSDHGPFVEAGVPAVTLIDYDGGSIHIPEDTIDNIGMANLERDLGVIMRVLSLEATGFKLPYVRWQVLAWPALIIAVLVFVLARMRHRARERANWRPRVEYK